LTVTN